MKKEWDEEQLTLFEELVMSLNLGAQWTPSIALGRTGPKLTDEYIPVDEASEPYEQLDFDEIWAAKLRDKYGIKKPFAD